MDWIKEKLFYCKGFIKWTCNGQRSVLVYVKLKVTIKEIRGKIRWRRSEIIKLTI